MTEQFDYIAPMKASLSSVEFLSKVNNDSRWACGEKYDGYREVLYLGKEQNEMLSSLGNSHIAKCPQFQVVVPELVGTVVDCEGMAPTRYLEDNAACFKSDPYNAIAWQKSHGDAHLVAFDLLRLQGRDFMDQPFSTRARELAAVVFLIKQKWAIGTIKQEHLVYEQKLDYYNQIVARKQNEGHEGIILKDMCVAYRPGMRGAEWLKVKREETVYRTVTGFLPGVGKFEGLIGSIVFEGGSASGMDDDTRINMTYHKEQYIGHVVELKGQEITRLGSLRHPRYIRMVD